MNLCNVMYLAWQSLWTDFLISFSKLNKSEKYIYKQYGTLHKSQVYHVYSYIYTYGYIVNTSLVKLASYMLGPVHIAEVLDVTGTKPEQAKRYFKYLEH